MSFPKNGEYASPPSRQPTTSQLRASGLGLGLGLTDSFACASVDEDPDLETPQTRKTHEQVEAAKLKLEAARKRLQENVQRVKAAEKARETITDSELAAKGIDWDFEAMFNSDFLEQTSPTKSISPRKRKVKPVKKHHDFFSSLANTPELFMELAKHLHIKSLLSLYCISKDFHETINGHLSHCMKACAEYMAPDCAKLYLFKFYGPLCVPDPGGRPHPTRPSEVRKVPGLKWLQMVVHREKTVRNILASMARQGHRMPKTMAFSLKKMWLVMDISTSSGRVQMMHSQNLFTDIDLYNIQLFVCKLDMRFNDPIDGPGDESMRKLFLGQRGLTPLAHLLKRTQFLEMIDVIKLGVRYSYVVRPEHRGLEVFGIPPEEIGIAHLEGWGSGRVHLMRPDELVMRESVRRQLGLKNHIMEMMLWGYVDPISGRNIEATDEERYISDDEETPRHEDPFSDYWPADSDEESPQESGEEDGDGDDDNDNGAGDEGVDGRDGDQGEEDGDEQDGQGEETEENDEEDEDEDGPHEDDDDDDNNYFFVSGST